MNKALIKYALADDKPQAKKHMAGEVAGMSTTERPKRGVPEGLWVRCPQCKATVFKRDVE